MKHLEKSRRRSTSVSFLTGTMGDPGALVMILHSHRHRHPLHICLILGSWQVCWMAVFTLAKIPETVLCPIRRLTSPSMLTEYRHHLFSSEPCAHDILCFKNAPFICISWSKKICKDKSIRGKMILLSQDKWKCCVSNLDWLHHLLAWFKLVVLVLILLSPSDASSFTYQL